jgi:kynurenine formamidase
MSDFPFQLFDLTWPLNERTPHWNGGCGFESFISHDYNDAPGETQFRIQKIQMRAGMGTHMDAPSHCIANGQNISEIPLDKLVVPCVVIDISKRKSEKNLLTVEDVKDFEKKHGSIVSNAFVIVNSGWGLNWHNPDKYRNNLIFPSVSVKAADHLCERNIAGLGIDTLSPDLEETGFPVHRLLLGAGKYIVENIANADQLPPKGSFSAALPMKIDQGTEAPTRLVGLVKK